RRRDRLAARLLGCEVLAGAENRAGLRDAVLDVERARDAEVGHLHLALAAEEDVLRLHVAMDEPVLVCEGQPVGNREGELESASDRQPARALDELLEVLPLDMLEDDVLPAAVVAAVDDGDDVRMGQPRDQPRLAAKALEVLRIGDVPLAEDL